jgi:hypothetical protein
MRADTEGQRADSFRVKIVDLFQLWVEDAVIRRVVWVGLQLQNIAEHEADAAELQRRLPGLSIQTRNWGCSEGSQTNPQTLVVNSVQPLQDRLGRRAVYHRAIIQLGSN